jgi:two-component system nitrogen regulation response regulator GlnG
MPALEPWTSDAAQSSSVKSTTLVLVVDDDPLVGQIVRAALPTAEFATQNARTAAQAISMWDHERPSVVVLDHVLPDSDGLSLLAQFRQRDSTLPVIFVTAHGSSQTAIDAMKCGAFDYLSKPLDLAKLESQVRLAREARRLMRVPVVISAEREDSEAGDPLIGRSAGMAEVFKGIGRAAARDMSVLLVGERGTGKALVARAIYQNSSRSAAPFRVVSCSDFDPQQLEVEVFGAEDSSSVVGRLEQCSGGTLLLEEIGHTTLHLQSRLMRLLTTGEFEAIGGESTKTANVRIFATSSHDLESLVAAGSFRSDLYYHLRSLSLHLPPLRERPGDIPLLVDHFVKRFSRLSSTLNRSTVRVSAEALQLLTSYSWPGNLDQLQSVLRQALIENTGTVLPSSSLQTLLQSPDSAEPTTGDRATNWRTFVSDRLKASTSSLYAESLSEMERHVLTLVMEQTDHNQAKSARLLGITRGNLRKKLRALGLSPAAPAGEDLDLAIETEDE